MYLHEQNLDGETNSMLLDSKDSQRSKDDFVVFNTCEVIGSPS